MAEMLEEVKMLDTEEESEYKFRICGIREKYGMTWQDVADVINAELGANYSESKYRKEYHAALSGYRKGYADASCTEPPMSEEAEEDEFFAKMLELKKEKVKLSDERIQTNAYIRRLAREETIEEIALQLVEKIGSQKLLPEITPPVEIAGENEAILCIGDWHYGIQCDNYWNKYNPEIARERIAKLYEETRRRCLKHEVKHLHVVNLGDMIAGRIHLGLRLESRFDVITQVIEISEILAEMLNKLAAEFPVSYYDCIDNHSRLEPNKKDAMDLESLARITPWYLKSRLGDAVEIKDNKYGEDIITFESLGYKILGVHGDKDNPRDVVDHLSMMTHEHYDMILTAHLHHFSGDEKNETVVVSNGSLMGTDTYARGLRLSSKPSQNLIIVTPKNVADDICRIVLD